MYFLILNIVAAKKKLKIVSICFSFLLLYLNPLFWGGQLATSKDAFQLFLAASYVLGSSVVSRSGVCSSYEGTVRFYFSYWLVPRAVETMADQKISEKAKYPIKNGCSDTNDGVLSLLEKETIILLLK